MRLRGWPSSDLRRHLQESVETAEHFAVRELDPLQLGYFSLALGLEIAGDGLEVRGGVGVGRGVDTDVGGAAQPLQRMFVLAVQSTQVSDEIVCRSRQALEQFRSAGQVVGRRGVSVLGNQFQFLGVRFDPFEECVRVDFDVLLLLQGGGRLVRLRRNLVRVLRRATFNGRRLGSGSGWDGQESERSPHVDFAGAGDMFVRPAQPGAASLLQFSGAELEEVGDKVLFGLHGNN